MMLICRNVFLITSIVVIGNYASINWSFGQSASEERTSVIDWADATSDAERSLSTAPALNDFRAKNSDELALIKLPVLMPNTKIVDASPRLRGQGNSYVIAYALPAAKLSLLGTSGFLTRPDDQVFGQSATGRNRIFDQSDDGSDLSFLKYGASYVLRLSCAKPEDERCARETFLNAIADSLVVVGGKK